MVSPIPPQTVSRCREFLCFDTLSYLSFRQSVSLSLHTTCSILRSFSAGKFGASSFLPCEHTYVHTYMSTYKHTFTHIYTLPKYTHYLHTFIHNTYTHIHTLHTYTLTYTCKHTYTHIHKYTQTFQRTYIHTYKYTHTHTHTQTHTHTIRTVPTLNTLWACQQHIAVYVGKGD